MPRTDSTRRGFSLMEVTTALGIISFALVALLGVFPLGLENSRMCVGETRATQLVKMITATLESEPFTAAPCFATVTPLDLSQEESWPQPGDALPGASASQPETDPVTLYVSYDARQEPRIVRATSAPSDAIYRVELRFRTERLAMPAGIPVAGSPAAPAAAKPVIGSTMLVRMTDLTGPTGLRWAALKKKEAGGATKFKKGLLFETQAFIPKYSRTAALK